MNEVVKKIQEFQIMMSFWKDQEAFLFYGRTRREKLGRFFRSRKKVIEKIDPDQVAWLEKFEAHPTREILNEIIAEVRQKAIDFINDIPSKERRKNNPYLEELNSIIRDFEA